ncbi:CapA family protein [Vibrio crassostreae]|uniref:CapA family protein n=1 Tax=Vibrio crassostreae TaxID=246167 RepID=UPI00352D8DAC
MNFYGDVNLPYLNVTESVFHDGMKREINVFNFESTIVSDSDKVVTDGIALKSNFKSVERFYELGFSIACLANNHITDYDDSVNLTIQKLSEIGFKTFGAADSLEHAENEFKISIDGIDHYIIAAGWDVIGCKYASKKSPGVNAYNSLELKRKVEDIRSIDKSAIIYCSFHYNYEFELYPQPADRLLFHELIDLGVDCIIGHHSHLIGPYECYNGKYIFYSLGNFYMPEITSRGYHLKYPEIAYKGISVELTNATPKIHHYQTVNDTIKHIKTTTIDESDLNDLCNLVGSESYLCWFKKNRRKSKLLPIFTNYDNYIDTKFKAFLVKSRNYLINLAVRFNLKK